MNTVRIFKIDCIGLDATYKFGAQIAKRLHGGEVIELIGDLGSGKTALVRGIMSFFNTEDDATSPSFTINNVYHAGNLTFYHYDFYRLVNSGVVGNELSEVLGQDDTVVIIEWGSSVENLLPSNTVRIFCNVTGESSRQYDCRYHSDSGYLFNGEKYDNHLSKN